jgi:hypothetical protein
MELDHQLKQEHPDVKFVRYMDDYGMVCSNKRHLQKAVRALSAGVRGLGMRLKKTLQVFQIRIRGMKFLSYRFFHGFTLLAKPLMYRIARRIRKAASHLSPHTAAGVVSYLGVLKHCDSYNFRKEYVYPFISIKQCKEVIRNATKDRIRRTAGAV